MDRGVKKISLLHLGIGNVGKEVVAQIQAQKDEIVKQFGLDLVYCGLFTVRNGVFAPDGLSEEKIRNDLSEARYAPVDIEKMVLHAIDEMETPFILIDTTASDSTFPFLEKTLKKGGYVVLSNKKPLAGSLKQFENLQRLGKNRIYCETVVGAGLPVIQTLKNLLITGDEISEIQGCFSGTLGYLFSQLDTGKKFSEVVMQAKKLGYTEPDPRDDLGGVDVARKALILSRFLGQKKELSDIALTGLYPKEMGMLSVDEFMSEIKKLDDEYAEKVKNAKTQGKVLRFVATVTQTDCRVGLEAVEKTSDIGSLQGPDNIIIFKTKRYFDNPLVIKGPGAGLAVTAAGVFADILSSAQIITGGIHE
jgi:homoserine dehydrogenase